jgi:starch-binding outer membrane protein, SusD/RagB family
MKQYNKIKVFLLLALVGILSQCSDFLELTPPMTQVTDNFYRTPTDAFQALTAAYEVLTWSAPSTASGSPQNAAFEVISEVLGDCCYGGGANANDIPSTVRLSRFQTFTSDPAPEALWHKYYTGIYRTNLFLEKIDTIRFDTTDLKISYKAEAKFLRAYYYFDLVRLFGNVPLILKTLTPADYAQKQASPDLVYQQIASDLLDAINAKKGNGTSALVISSAVQAATDKGRVTKAAAEALLTRVWLYYTGYYGQTQLGPLTSTDIMGYCEDVINNSGNDLLATAYSKTNIIAGTKIGVAPLFDVANKNNIESVFEIQFSGLSKWGDWSNRQGCTGNQAVILWGIRDVSAPYASGWSFAPVSKKLFDKFNVTDPRRLATLINANKTLIAGDDGEGLNFTAGYQNTGYFCRKFTPLVKNNGAAGSRELNYPNDYPAIRFADVLLMGSELQLLYGDKAKALTYYKRVRERAMGAGYVTITSDQLTLDLIYDERVFELALEGQRYWDILRRGQTYASSILTNNETGDFARTYNTATMGLLPIPQFDIAQSKNSLIQNPGY